MKMNTSKLPARKREACQNKKQAKALHISQLIDWLDCNYELKERSCIPRCLLYRHYLEYCHNDGESPLGPAIFGKIIRTQFKPLTTRRLGTRGQSKYHYFGLAVKATSAFSIGSPTIEGLTRFTSNAAQPKTTTSNRKEVKTLLEGFPRIKDRSQENVENSGHKDQIATFLVMYEAHCQRIIDTVVAANFDDVKTSIMHFWCSMPKHVNDILESKEVHDVIIPCDHFLYKKIIDVLIPSSVQEIPESFKIEVSNFIKSFLPWLDICLMNIPKDLGTAKMKVAKLYMKLIQRQLSFLFFAQPAKKIISDVQQASRMIKDLEITNLREVLGIANQGAADQNNGKESSAEHLGKFFSEVLVLLKRQSQVESYLCSLDEFLYKVVIQPTENLADTKMARNEFVLSLSHILSKLMQDLTLRNSEAFGNIHILISMVMEYSFLALESKMVKDEEEFIWSKVDGIGKEKKGTKYGLDCVTKRKPIPKFVGLDKRQNGNSKRIIGTKLVHKSSPADSTPVSGSNTWQHTSQSNASQGSHYKSVIHYQPPCNAKSAVDENLHWMSVLPSFQDMVANNNWIDLQGSDVVFPQ